MSFQENIEGAMRRFHIERIDARVLIGCVVIGLIVVCLCVPSFMCGEDAEAFEITSSPESGVEHEVTDPAGAESVESLYVHVTGAVNKPGICTVAEGSRVADAIEAAGGARDDASLESLNLARSLVDGEQIRVPTFDEAASPGSSTGDVANSESSAINADGRININTATSQELQSLSGIGQSKAEKIIAYRDSHGAFESIDDLVNVNGIGEKTLDSIRDSIRV